MKNPKITCPKCQSIFTLQSKSGQLKTDWDNLGFSCSNCQQKIMLNNNSSETNRMKKIQFQYTCSNKDCKTINTIQVFESSVGKNVISTCKNCKQVADVLVPVTEKPIANDCDSNRDNPTRTYINPEKRGQEAKLILHIPATSTNSEQQFEVNQMYMSIGRKNETNNPDIAIETSDLNMSRFHAVIKKNERSRTFSITDNGSTNKTFHNEKKLLSFDDKTKNEEYVLNSGDKIRLGSTIIHIQFS